MNQKDGPRRQFVSFSFYRVLPEWRRLPLEEREQHRREFGDVIHKWNVPETMRVLSYSLTGTRGDADMMLWRICYSVSCLQEMAADLLRTRLGGYLETPYSYLGMTRQSGYVIGEDDRQHSLKGVARPGESQFLFMYPLVRTRAWYMLPFEDRQRMVRELVDLARDFADTHLHVIYSFGLDDQDFVVAVETDHPERYVERIMRGREVEASPYTQRDTPMFTCVRASVEEMLERIG
ncbi:MAG: chlorite dismutase family protein [Terriglobales bacterium]